MGAYGTNGGEGFHFGLTGAVYLLAALVVGIALEGGRAFLWVGLVAFCFWLDGWATRKSRGRR